MDALTQFLVFLVLSLGLFTPACASGVVETGEATLQEADNAYMQLDLRAARALLTNVLDNTESPAKDRAEAARRLGTISWRFDGATDAALVFLARAGTLGLEPSRLFREQARLYLHAAEFRLARQAAWQAIESAATGGQAADAREVFGQVVVEEVMALPAGSGISDSLAADLQRARDSLKELTDKEPGLLDASRLLLSLALVSDDGLTALTAWKSYYSILPESRDKTLLAGAAAVLERELHRWHEGRGDPLRRTRVIRALASSGFHRIAAWLANKEGPKEDAEVRAIVGYARFLNDVQGIAEEYFRLSALGSGSRREFQSAFYEAGRRLWSELAWPKGVPAFTQRGLRDEIGRRFRALVKFEDHDGVLCLHLGTRIIDTDYTVEQYGNRASLGFMVLDAMIANGYNSWFWDGVAAAGGWVDERGSIVQVRPAYAEGPVRAWRRVAYPEDRREWEELIDTKSASDDGLARENPYAYLPGLASRLQRRAYERIRQGLTERGVPEHEQRAAFTRELSRRTHASSILAHEGRHAIDKRTPLSFLRSHAEKEYRAKLSEIALAPDPGLALTGGILSANIGGSSNHGQANERIVKVLVKWMRANENQIQGFDRSRPHVPQLDLLTDDQLRAAVQAVDPLML